MTYLRINKITKKKYQNPVPVYCVNVEPYHRILVNNGILTKQSINFGLLFGMSHFTYANNIIRKEWNLDRCKNFCKEHDIKLLDSIYAGQIDYQLSVAKYLRDKFFETYPNLSVWHNSSHEFVKKNGYIRSPHGARRLLPQLLHIGDDKKLEANLKNISLNSPVQNFEIILISRAMRKIHNYIKENQLKSRIMATVHDAVVFYIYKNEVDLMQKVIPEIMEETYSEYGVIPIQVEGDLSDPRSKENKSFWGYGIDWYS